MSEPEVVDLDRARRLVAAVLAADDADELVAAGPAEDLRDYGLDSVRVMGVLDALLEGGADIEFADLVAEPTLARIAAALPARPEHTDERENR
jgi:bifunctional isochorismate lyase/aryl carrier protein